MPLPFASPKRRRSRFHNPTIASFLWGSLALWVCLTSLTFLTDSSFGEESDARPGIPSAFNPNPSLYLQGRHVFQRNCLLCHGRFGDGNGEMAKDLTIRPRDFTKGIFKFRSTPSGFLPTDDDLHRTIRNGLAGTAMPAFVNLEERDVRAVIEYLKTLSRKWRDPSQYSPPLSFPAPPPWRQDPDQLGSHAERGRILFNQTCALCHPLHGDRSHVLSTSFTNVWSQPVTAPDLGRDLIRGGADATNFYRILATGLNGTPMPSFADSLSEDQKWDLVVYLEEQRQGEKAERNVPAKSDSSEHEQ